MAMALTIIFWSRWKKKIRHKGLLVKQLRSKGTWWIASQGLKKVTTRLHFESSNLGMERFPNVFQPPSNWNY